MAGNKILVVASFKSKAGTQGQLKTVLQKMAREASKDRGCLRFELAQNENDDTLFIFSECWESRKHLENHLKMPYISLYRNERKPFLDGDPQVSTWIVVS